MIKLSDIAPKAPRVVEIEPGEVAVYALSLGQIGALAAKHSAIISSFKSKPSDDENPDARGARILNAVLSSGPSAVSDIIDAGTKSESGTAAELSLSAIDEASILLAVIDETIPKNEQRLEKFVAELESLLGRLGLN